MTPSSAAVAVEEGTRSFLSAVRLDKPADTAAVPAVTTLARALMLRCVSLIRPLM